ncbi:hypothetical protein A2165_00770 [Candidatus Curtissbacteria bacterium RBG_13_40_7]|uniref:Uncharacterized protein n=1 Tax=Candidatus Curtissbacteria bacterium RBG_13_40_7 TaxID=1797706 RepID=A0A1F5FUG2_9BACT|nr:MAG: hypothetical protein A2165_00770 [Candidatus Curtissbacteria bacterium RBG_13_40_7]
MKERYRDRQTRSDILCTRKTGQSLAGLGRAESMVISLKPKKHGAIDVQGTIDAIQLAKPPRRRHIDKRNLY